MTDDREVLSEAVIGEAPVVRDVIVRPAQSVEVDVTRKWPDTCHHVRQSHRDEQDVRGGPHVRSDKYDADERVGDDREQDDGGRHDPVDRVVEPR